MSRKHIAQQPPGQLEESVQLAPSILAADFARLGEQVAQAEQSLRQITHLPLEMHMMISDPDFFLDEFVEAGSDSCCCLRNGSESRCAFHYEQQRNHEYSSDG